MRNWLKTFLVVLALLMGVWLGMTLALDAMKRPAVFDVFAKVFFWKKGDYYVEKDKLVGVIPKEMKVEVLNDGVKISFVTQEKVKSYLVLGETPVQVQQWQVGYPENGVKILPVSREFASEHSVVLGEDVLKPGKKYYFLILMELEDGVLVPIGKNMSLVKGPSALFELEVPAKD